MGLSNGQRSAAPLERLVRRYDGGVRSIDDRVEDTEVNYDRGDAAGNQGQSCHIAPLVNTSSGTDSHHNEHTDITTNTLNPSWNAVRPKNMSPGPKLDVR